MTTEGKAILIIEGNGDAANDRAGIIEFGLPIARDVDADLVSEGGEGAGQSANNVGQAASFGKRHAFRSHKCDVHECGTSHGTRRAGRTL